MKLTIIPSDNAVGVDGTFYHTLDLQSCNIPNDVHALQWQDYAGWIEITGSENQDIAVLPDWANCCLAKWEAENNKPIPDPLPPTEEQNKRQAVYLLQSTDWTTIPDVADPAKSNPYLGNVQDFVVYRNAVRQYAIYPVAGNINWPVEPQAVWLTAQ